MKLKSMIVLFTARYVVELATIYNKSINNTVILIKVGGDNIEWQLPTVDLASTNDLPSPVRRLMWQTARQIKYFIDPWRK